MSATAVQEVRQGQPTVRRARSKPESAVPTGLDLFIGPRPWQPHNRSQTDREWRITKARRLRLLEAWSADRC